MTRRQLLHASAVLAVLVVTLAGCSSSSAGDAGGSADSRSGGPAGSGSSGSGSSGSGGQAAAVPKDFPTDIPLPPDRPVKVSTARVPVGKQLWTLTYLAGSGGAAGVGAAEGAALKKAGFQATLEGDDGTGSYVNGGTSVVTAVEGTTLVVLVTKIH